MSEHWRRTRLPEIVAHLATRPGHESVRTAVSELLTQGLDCAYAEITHEIQMPEIRGRADAMFGATVFEFKRDLRIEQADVERRLPDYLRDREGRTGRRYLGIATDGATFQAYELRDGRLALMLEHRTSPATPDALLAWLEPAVSDRDDLPPEPLTVARELGRDSLTYRRALGILGTLWSALHDHPEVKLKRDLWNGLLREVYGAPVGDDGLFLQHTYLTILAKTLAARVLDVHEDEANALLGGSALARNNIFGAVESDSFDWVLQDPRGADLVTRIARQAGRFRLRDARVDLLKALYESLIDPDQRHDLGEYYTPDWLAAKVVAEAMTDPLRQRVLDPACGSGTFLFHAIRRLLATARAEGVPPADAVALCAEHVRGVDVHPVAVIIARVTWLLALGDAIQDRPASLHVPVFLGDAMQWNLRDTVDTRDVVVRVPDEPPLHVPAGLAEDQAVFEPALLAIQEGLADDATPAQIERQLARMPGVQPQDAAAMADTFRRLQALFRDGRDGIWPYVFRNLVRPLWLSRPEQQADVLLGNPPWVAYRHLSAEMQARLKEASQRMNLWVGGVLSTQQDLCALFLARAVRLYLRPGGGFALVMPYAALNRPAYAGLRAGDWRDAQGRITAAWTLDETVQPLFPVPACVLFGARGPQAPPPRRVRRFSGSLPRRDATEHEADRALAVDEEAWPPGPTLMAASPYRARFTNGATIYPRRFFVVQRVQGGRVAAAATPNVEGKAGAQDKAPWRSVDPPRGPVEAAFLRPLLLGESIAPFRILEPALAVIPVEGGHVLDSAAARSAGHRNLSLWLRDCEAKWAQHAQRTVDGKPRMALAASLDHMRKLTRQFPTPPARLLYAKAGTLMAAVVVTDPAMIVDHMAYWASVRSVAEGRYLAAILNSEHLRAAIAPMQAKGQGGARHFDNLMWELPIPLFDGAIALHQDLAALAAEAERVAAAVPLEAGAYFTTQRRAIRAALAATGLAARLDGLVARLLAVAPP
jgi:SAM-dependent methyltransferase